jgi:hypothetical protein
MLRFEFMNPYSTKPLTHHCWKTRNTVQHSSPSGPYFVLQPGFKPCRIERLHTHCRRQCDLRDQRIVRSVQRQQCQGHSWSQQTNGLKGFPSAMVCKIESAAIPATKPPTIPATLGRTDMNADASIPRSYCCEKNVGVHALNPAITSQIQSSLVYRATAHTYRTTQLTGWCTDRSSWQSEREECPSTLWTAEFASMELRCN